MRRTFGAFEFDCDAGELRKAGLRLRLRGQPLEILGALLAKPGEIVTREELQQQLWKGTTFVDFEHGLNAAVNKLRQALLDDAERPRYIETVPGVGYRFVGPVAGGAVAVEPAPRSWWTWAVGAGALVALAFWVGRVSSPAPAREPVRFQIPVPASLQLTGSQTFSLSPDGRTLVYLARGRDGRMTLWAQSFDAKEPRQLPGTEVSDGDPDVIWSPDSSLLVFYSSQALYRADLEGNPPVLLCRVPSRVLGGDWGADGTIIFGTETNGIMRVAAAGGEPVSITKRDVSKLERVHGWPTFLPDGKHFVFSRMSGITANSGIYIRSVDTPAEGADERMLVATPIAARMVEGTLLFQRERTVWAQELNPAQLRLEGEPRVVVEGVGNYRAFGYFSASRTGRLVYRAEAPARAQLAWWDGSGKRVGRLGEPALFDDNGPAVISPAGTQLVASKFEEGNSDIFGYDLARSVEQKLTFDPAIDLAPVWSFDGERVYFASGRSGHYDLYQIPKGGGTDQLLYASPHTKYPTSASPDGQFLVFETQTDGTNWDVWQLPLGGGAKPQRLLGTGADERFAKISPDGQWLAFMSNETGGWEVYVQHVGASGRARTKVSSGGGEWPSWQPASDVLYYMRPDKMLASVVVSAAGPGVPRMWFGLPSEDWTPSKEGRFLVSEPLVQPVEPFTAILGWK